jgi:hypothetical protein
VHVLIRPDEVEVALNTVLPEPGAAVWAAKTIRF